MTSGTGASGSRRVDRARMAYAMTTTEAPRQCVFFATTNDSHYLRDQTGNRRFWPVRIEKFDLVRLEADRDQLWAEAAHREAKGESIRLPEALWEAAAEQQALRMVENAFLPELDDLLRDTEGNPMEGKVAVRELMAALELPPARNNQYQTEQVAAAMRQLGWRKPDNKDGKLRVGSGRAQHVWVKGDGPHFRTIRLEPPRLEDGQKTPAFAYYGSEKPPPEPPPVLPDINY